MILVMLETIFISYAVASNKVLLETVEAILQSTVESSDAILTIDVDFDIGHPRWNYRLQPSLGRECVKIRSSYSILNIEDDIEATVKKMFTSCLLNPKGKFILLVQNGQSLKSIFDILLEYFIDKALVVVNNKDSCIIYSYKKIMSGLKFYRSGSYKNGKLLLSEDAFKSSLSADRFKSLKTFSLYYPPYAMDEKTGIISEVAQIVGSHLNVDINMTIIAPKHFGTITNDNNFSGVFLDLANRNYDCYAGLNIPPEKAPYYFDLTLPVVEDRSSFVVPLLLEVRPFSYIFTGEYTWSALICYVSTCFVIPMIWSRFFERVERKQFGWIQILQINLDMPVSLKPNTVSAKTVLMSQIVAVLILNTIYRSKLYNFITDDRSMLKIRIADDIVGTTLKAGVHNYVFDQINSSTEQSRVNRFIIENHIICNASDYCVNRTAFQKDIFTVKLSRKMDYLIPLWYLDENGNSLVHVIEGFDVSFVHFPFVFLKGHPLFERFNRLLMIMKENGFVDMKYKEVERNSKKAMSLALQSSNMQAYPLNLEHFECIFIVYGLGVVISVIVFILEVSRVY